MTDGSSFRGPSGGFYEGGKRSQYCTYEGRCRLLLRFGGAFAGVSRLQLRLKVIGLLILALLDIRWLPVSSRFSVSGMENSIHKSSRTTHTAEPQAVVAELI